MLPTHDHRGHMLPHTARDYLNARPAPVTPLEREWGLGGKDHDKRLGWLIMWQGAIALSQAQPADDALAQILENHGLPH